VSFCVLFVCRCVLYYCHWVATRLQLTNISYIIYIYIYIHIIYHLLVGSSIKLISFPSAYVGRSYTILHSYRSKCECSGAVLSPGSCCKICGSDVYNRKHPQGADRPCADLAVCRLLCWMWVRRTDQHRVFSARLRLTSYCFLLD
jgi:hypothetical protein